LYSGHPDRELAAMVRICAHYFSNGAWLADDALIRDAGRLAGIPGVLIQGRPDMSGPPDSAWELVKRWPDAELHILDGAGHQTSPARRELLLAALDRFARARVSWGTSPTVLAMKLTHEAVRRRRG